MRIIRASRLNGLSMRNFTGVGVWAWECVGVAALGNCKFGVWDSFFVLLRCSAGLGRFWLL